MNIEGTGRQEKQGHVEEALAKRFAEAATREMRHVNNLESQKDLLLGKFEERFTGLFPEEKLEIEKLTREIRETDFPDKYAFIGALAKRFAHLLATIAPAEELERRMREGTAEQHDWTVLNEALSYACNDGESIELHIPLLITKNPLGTYRLFTDGLKTLAQQLRSDPQLSNATQVMGYSWIIFEHPELLRKLGFTVEKMNEREHKALAWMTKEDFLARFG